MVCHLKPVLFSAAPAVSSSSQVLEQYSKLSDSYLCFPLILQHALDADNAGVSPVGNSSNSSSHWDLGSAFFFAGTVITTIGIQPFTTIFSSADPYEEWVDRICLLKLWYQILPTWSSEHSCFSKKPEQGGYFQMKSISTEGT